MDKIKTVEEIAQGVMYKSIRELIDEAVVRQMPLRERYILEQCGKLYRVKDTYADAFERYKTGWLNLKQARGFVKLLKGNDEYDL